MLIYFVRHGQTPGNKEKRFQKPDTPLSPEGEIQAQKLSDRLQKTTLDEMWTSPMIRAYKTAEFINQYHQLPLKKEPLLAEMKRATSIHGQLISDPRYSDISQLFEHRKDYDPYFRYEDGESFVDLIDRCKKIVAKLEARAKEVPADHVLCVVTHGIILATLFEVILFGDLGTPQALVTGLRKLKIENTSLTIIKVDAATDWRVVTFSDFAHL